MPITKTVNKESVRLCLEGAISDRDMPALANHFIGNLNKTITLDMKDTSSIDALTIHMLRATRSIVKKYGGNIVIVNVPKGLAGKPAMRALGH